MRKLYTIQLSRIRIYYAAKGIPSVYGIFFVSSRHVETVVLMSRVENSFLKKGFWFSELKSKSNQGFLL